MLDLNYLIGNDGKQSSVSAIGGVTSSTINITT